MLEDLEYLKKWCKQDHTGLSGYGVARAIERMVDDLIVKYAAQPLRAVDAAMPPSAEPLSGSNIVPAVEVDTQPRP